MAALSSVLQLFLLIAASFFVILAFSSFAGFPPRRLGRPMLRSAIGNRKLLEDGYANITVEHELLPTRMGESCSASDLTIQQVQTAPLPNGIPTYTVNIINQCLGDECRIGNIHVACGWYSSARLVNPRIFRRLGYDDCLVNDGRPIPMGQAVSFQYANSFSYPMRVSRAKCMP